MKIFIIYTSAGDGHKQAARAIAAALTKHAPQIPHEAFDAMDHGGLWFRYFYASGYLLLVRLFPALWGWAFKWTNHPRLNPVLQAIRRRVNRWQSARLVRKIALERPDLIISTHFYPLDVLSDLKLRGRTSARVLGVVTDYDVHRFWAFANIERYCVALPATAVRLINLGLDPQKVRVTGLPLRPTFLQPLDRPALRIKYELTERQTVILLMGGGMGSGPLEQAIGVLDVLERPFSFLVICGNNRRLFESLNRRKTRHPMKIFGYTHHVHELMGVSDILVTKPGGLTVAEAVASRLPMVLMSPIPGQEEANAEVSVRMGTARLGRDLAQVQEIVRDLLTRPSELQKMREAAAACGYPDATDQIVQTALELLNSPT